MSYAKTVRKINELTTCEVSTMKAEGQTFRSKYEAESVIRIQAGQAEQEAGRCRAWVEAITDAVSLQRDIGLAQYAEELQKHAEYLATEAVRLAAVAKSLAELLDKERGERA